ncbi:hypothetical protein OH76DRAFT_724089 [Lentinus brumalis]|uniref:Uncharacterized protein n=1 Tax=Lentinus brumalis TaxID=2498619 RepID=A0A371D526_9APHY|nr:hypothetical protein OH76DRAFT_724089 [Polyporus brumalis]
MQGVCRSASHVPRTEPPGPPLDMLSSSQTPDRLDSWSHAYGREEHSPSPVDGRRHAARAWNTPALATSTSTSRQPSFSPAANKRPTDTPRRTLASKSPTHARSRTGHPQHLRTCTCVRCRSRRLRTAGPSGTTLPVPGPIVATNLERRQRAQLPPPRGLRH